MTPTFPHSSSPANPSKMILWALISLLLAGHLTSFWIPLPFFTLSLFNFSQGALWTLLTYPFVPPSLGGLDLFIRLFFDPILLWVFGGPLLERMGQARFAYLFFGTTILAGFSALLGLYLWPTFPLFAGLSPPLFALLTVWTILQAGEGSHLASFLLRPWWIFLLLVGTNLLIAATNGHWTNLLADTTGILCGYAFSLVSEKTRSTIGFLYPLERFILRTLDRCHTTKEVKLQKIIDFQTGEPVLTDEQFMDAMLAKISHHGENHLSTEEKRRMHRISEIKAGKKL